MQSVSPRYANVLGHVDELPRTATEIFRRWADIPEHKALTRRYRNERRWVGRALQNLAEQGVIQRDVIVTHDKTWVGFWRQG